MATALTASSGVGFDFNITLQTALDNAVDRQSMDIRNGPTTLFHAFIDNNTGAADTELEFVKFYDVEAGLVAGTTEPDFIIPVVPVTVAATSNVHGVGWGTWLCLEGVPFSNGLSVLASQEAGDTMTAAPTEDLKLHTITT